MEFFNDHKKLFLAAFGLFIVLTLFVAIFPAIENQENNQPLPNYKPLTASELRGKNSFVSNGCVACHTQQVRNVEMDNVWGERPGIAADYAGVKRLDFWRNSATLMGTERTGPDLTNVGKRQPSMAWNLLHLYQPRAVVPTSIMPSYKWLFEPKEKLEEDDVEVIVPSEFLQGEKRKIVASQEALDLVAYLQSLKQVSLPTGEVAGDFLYKKEISDKPMSDLSISMPDGE
jgi:cytochrome c oxidase cbb3-type subunit 2